MVVEIFKGMQLLGQLFEKQKKNKMATDLNIFVLMNLDMRNVYIDRPVL
jgi:hypothetical protein